MIRCYVHDLRRISYEEAFRVQKQAVGKLQDGTGDECFFLLEHPHVITCGRSASRDSLLCNPALIEEKGGSVVETDRGGDVTYHGPGQLVGYPIFKLEEDRRDVRRYAFDIESALIKTLAPYGIHCDHHPEYTGVWTQGRKIASIGLRISRWVTCHGFALNVNTDLSYFSLIRPCGIPGCVMTSMEQELGAPADMSGVKDNIVRSFSQVFAREMIPQEQYNGIKTQNE
ncbi:MAG: lipoyl(octanoyl) transferase LipB [Candidatus Latescibacterota bacterium]